MEKNSCSKCGKNATFSLDQRPYCSSCYKRFIEKKIKKKLREASLKKNDHLLVIGDLASYLLNKIITGLPLALTTKKTLPTDLSPYDVIIIQDTLDDACSGLLERFIFSKKMQKPTSQQKTIALLEPITDQEAQHYAKLCGIPFKPKQKPKRSQELLAHLKHLTPHATHNLIKSKKELEVCLEKKEISKQK